MSILFYPNRSDSHTKAVEIPFDDVPCRDAAVESVLAEVSKASPHTIDWITEYHAWYFKPRHQVFLQIAIDSLTKAGTRIRYGCAYVAFDEVHMLGSSELGLMKEAEGRFQWAKDWVKFDIEADTSFWEVVATGQGHVDDLEDDAAAREEAECLNRIVLPIEGYVAVPMSDDY